MTAIAILGRDGRMGCAIAEAAAAAGISIAAAIGREGDAIGAAHAGDVLIDFTLPDALGPHLDAAVGAGTPILIGTTGLGPAHQAAIDRAAKHVPVLQAANTSLGVAVLRVLARQAAALLGDGWDVSLVDTHHRYKRDAPSGTALLLGEATGRSDIAYASLRGGTVAGDHQLVFAGNGERIELGHRAEGRIVFAQGALRAALWLAEPRAPGRYGMDDVLGLT